MLAHDYAHVTPKPLRHRHRAGMPAIAVLCLCYSLLFLQLSSPSNGGYSDYLAFAVNVESRRARYTRLYRGDSTAYLRNPRLEVFKRATGWRLSGDCCLWTECNSMIQDDVAFGGEFQCTCTVSGGRRHGAV